VDNKRHDMSILYSLLIHERLILILT